MYWDTLTLVTLEFPLPVEIHIRFNACDENVEIWYHSKTSVTVHVKPSADTTRYSCSLIAIDSPSPYMYMYVRSTVQLSPESRVATLLQSAESRLQTHLKLHTCTLYGTVRRSGIDTNSRELSAVYLYYCSVLLIVIRLSRT